MTSPLPVSLPLGAPTLNGNRLTVDQALNQPNRITKRVADLTLQKFIVDRIFATTGTPVSGGAIIYDQASQADLYTSRDIERRMPGDEYPLVQGTRGEPKIAEVEDYGGKFFVTDEARKRNDSRLLDLQVRQVSNTIVRKVNARAIAELDTALAEVGGAGTFAGHNWSTVVTAGASASSNSAYPAADFANAQLLADRDELGVTYDLWLLHPNESANLKIVYGADLGKLLEANGIEVFVSNRVTAGTGYALAREQVGFLEYEYALQTETWREQNTRRTWVQSFVVPVMGVTNPYAIRRVTGLAG